jgi:hypothetical protein
VLLRNGERSILPLFGRCRTVVVRLEDATWLRNLNTREDYRSYLRSLTGRQSGRTEEGPRVSGRKKRTDSALSKKR